METTSKWLTAPNFNAYPYKRYLPFQIHPNWLRTAFLNQIHTGSWYEVSQTTRDFSDDFAVKKLALQYITGAKSFPFAWRIKRWVEWHNATMACDGLPSMKITGVISNTPFFHVWFTFIGLKTIQNIWESIKLLPDSINLMNFLPFVGTSTWIPGGDVRGFT